MDGAAGIAMGGEQGTTEDFMVQYIVVRRDLQSELVRASPREISPGNSTSEADPCALGLAFRV